MRTALIVPTLNAGTGFAAWLAAYAAQRRPADRCLVIDSSSDDDTAARARAAGLEVHVISRAEFNHGGTRQRAVAWLADAEIVAFATQDALFADDLALDRLFRAFDSSTVGAAYGRQLPHVGARPIGAHARLYNYPPRGAVRTLEDRTRLGLKTVFISNSFAAYRRAALLAVGGFPTDTIMNEDTFVAGRLLLAGWQVAYCAEAQVHHSHDYGVAEEFRRYFDIGVFHAREAWLRETFGVAESEGGRYVRSELHYLAREAPWLIPSAVLRNAAKWAGYRLGCAESRLPARLKRGLSMHRRYWSAP